MCAEVLMGLGSAVPLSIDEDLEILSPEFPALLIRSITAGFRIASRADNLEADADALNSEGSRCADDDIEILTGLSAVSELPSTLMLSSLRERLAFSETTPFLESTTSYRLELADTASGSCPSEGLLTLLRSALRGARSSACVVAPRAWSLKAPTDTEAIAGSAAAAFIIFCKNKKHTTKDKKAVMVVMDDALDDCGIWE